MHPKPQRVHPYSSRNSGIRATIYQLSEGGPAISLHRLPMSSITPKQAREFARQINEIANAADQGEVGVYPQEGL
ncbi:hypothetical protein ABQX22_13495 [Xanthomonas sp. WHRI 1810A]|uniref:hypothetical protein n=1 Tax=Xanthomonas sp. WHRI 1810A TaxID=3161565 RepID=UPI0032E8C992